MGKIHTKVAHGLGSGNKSEEPIFNKNHFSGLMGYSPEVRDQISNLGLTRVAGNVFEAKSTKDFWVMRGNKIIKLVGGNEAVDNHESIPAAPSDRPEAFLAHILDDLSF